ncbi:MAG TPA: hypothetical protein VIL35_11390, partial [Vicinamibacterales bacterium]
MTYPEYRHLGADDRRAMALGAASVFERTALALPADSGGAEAFAPTEQALAVLRTWIQAYSPGNPEAFERRLTWDDLTLADVARALSAPPAAVLEPDWLRWVDQIIAAAHHVSADRANGPLPERALYAPGGPEPTPPPFLDLLVP